MIFSYLLNMQSHPSWVCGLKLQTHRPSEGSEKSHPSWVCGLKLIWSYHICVRILSHTLRGCVD